MSPSSYGHAYLTSYGWTGAGTGLRNGAIDKPLTIPPKKNISGLGKDRDEAFPFWDHLFTVASKAITIKLSSDDKDADEESNAIAPPEDTDTDTDTDTNADPLRRTTTGILSTRRPVSGTPATTTRPSLLATAKREAAKRGLYARFFKGPVLGPDDDGEGPSAASSSPSPSLSSGESSGSRANLASVSASTSTFKFSSVSAFIEHGVVGHVDNRDEGVEAKKSKKRKSKEDGEETREERRERKRLKRERKAARAAKRAEKVLKKEKVKDDGGDKKEKSRKHARQSLLRSQNGLEPEKCTQSKSDATLALKSGQQETSHELHCTDAVPTFKKRRKRKDITS